MAKLSQNANIAKIMFPSIKSPSQVPAQNQNQNQIGQRPGVPQQIPQIEPIVYQPSAKLKHLININKWQFLIVNLSIGVGIVNLFRVSPSHIFLRVVGIIAGSLSLFFISLADSTYVGLWRTGGAALAFGGILTFWDLYHFLTWHHYFAIVLVVILAMWIIGAGSR